MKLTAEEFVKKYPFIHLHNHTDKSFKDGHSTFDSVIDRCIECDMPGIAVTEHGNMFDAMGFDIKAKKAGIKHIFGCEVYVLPEGDSTTVLRDNNPDEKSDNIYVKNFHLIVLAYNRTGLTNLHKLLSVANDCGYEGASVGDHFYYTARVKFEELEKYKEGLIVSSACMGGEVPRLLAQGRTKEAIRVAKRYHAVFGDNYYLEIMDHEDKKGRCIECQYEVNKKLIAMSQKFGIKLLLTNDCHYTRRSDYEGHKLLKCVSYNEEYYNAQNYNKYYPTKEFYIKSSQEMLMIAKKYGKPGIEAYKNTYRIYQQCDVEIDTHLHFPHAILPEGEQNSSDFLRKLVFKLAPIKYNMDDEQVASVVTARVEKELKDIDRGQFPDYFLNTYEIVKYAKENEILIGAGRGSGAGSIVANILNITDVDPLEFDLIWERFWNPGRCQFAEDGKTIIKASPPDIDIDVASTRRAEVIEFVKEHFGYHRVASIAVFGTFKAYALINAVSKVLHTPEDIVEQVKKAIPYMGSPTLAECLEECQELINLYDSNDEVREFIDKLKLIDGRAVNVGTHAGGVLITDKDMYEYTPIFNGKNGFTTQYPYETLEAIGCLKIDLLGHELETIIDRACMLIKERHGITINPYSIPFDDNKTYQMLKDIRLNGVPQLQADWVIPIIQNVQPDNIGDVIDLVTMIRPGSLNSGQTDKYQKYCMGEPVKPDVPELSPIVKDYKNCLLYQEQIMNLAVQLGGFTLEEADQLRKVCAKTKYADLAKPLLEKLESGMEKNKIPHRHILKILEIVKSFFSYSFNKAHAAGYGTALRNDTRVLTDSGFKRIDSLVMSDKIYGYDGKLHNLTGIFPQVGKHKMYMIVFNDNTTCVCDENHLWTYQTSRNRQRNDSKHIFYTKNLRYIINNVPLSCENKNGYKRWNIYIPMCKPIQFKHKDVKIDPYILGLLLGDGCIIDDSPEFTNSEKDLVDSLRAWCLSSDLKLNERCAGSYRIVAKSSSDKYSGCNFVINELRSLCLWGKWAKEKFIPDLYLYNDVETRLGVLQGLIDTDGEVTENAQYFYSSISLQLCENVKFLVESLGGNAVFVNEERYSSTGNRFYRLTIKMPENIIPFRSDKHKSHYVPSYVYSRRVIKNIIPLEQSDYCTCISIDSSDGLFIIDNFIVTHNSTYRMAWFKANYFLEFCCSNLNSVIGDLEKSAKFLDELIAEDYKIYPPDINTSTFMWECRDDGVVMPINLIKGVGDTCAKAIVEERELKGDYKSFEDFVQRTPGKSVKKNNIQNMILCGAFDCFGLKRKALYDASEEYIAQLRETSKKKLFAQKPTHYDFYNGAEFTSFDIKEYEKSLLGINVTLSEHDLALKKKKIRARQTKLKAKVNASRKQFEQKSKSKSQTNNVPTTKSESKVVIRHNDESDVDNVVQSNSNARNKLNDLINNSQSVEHSVQKEFEKSLTIIVDNSLEFKFKLLKKLLDKYSENGDCQLKFFFFTKDKEVFSISTNTFIRLNDELLSKLKSRYGKDSFFVN